MKLDVKELIEGYLFKGTIQDRIEKFELAWDIGDYFEDIKENAKFRYWHFSNNKSFHPLKKFKTFWRNPSSFFSSS